MDVRDPAVDRGGGEERYTEALSRRSKSSNIPFCSPQKTSLDCASGTSRSSWAVVLAVARGGCSSPSGGTGVRSPMLDDRIGECAMREEIHELEGTSHNLRVESRDVERIFLPRAMMPVDDIARV